MLSRQAFALVFVAIHVAMFPALPASASPPRAEGEVAARLSITFAQSEAGAARAPGPFAVLPDGRIAIYIAESEGVLLLDGDRIQHHFLIPITDRGLDDMAASGTMLVCGRRPRGGAMTVDLFVLDLSTGRMIQRVQSANPFLRAPDDGPDRWRVVVQGDVVGVFEPSATATYPLWDRVAGPVTGSEQIVRSTAGLGLGDGAQWIPQPDGSLARKVRGRAEPFTTAEDGEFVDATADDVVVLLQGDRAARGRGVVPSELIVHVLEAEHAISELRLPALDETVDAESRAFSGRTVQLHERQLYWVHLGLDYLEIRVTSLPPRVGG